MKMLLILGAAAFLANGCATSDHPMNRPGGPDERAYNHETQKFEGRTDATGTSAAKRH